jgi:hypothetical protein
MAIHRVSVCLSDLDKDRLVKDKNGKVWLNLTIFESPQVTRTDDHLEIFQTASVEQKEAGVIQQRVGRGRTVKAR